MSAPRFFVFAVLAIAAFATAAWGDNDGARSFTLAPEISRSPQADDGTIAFQVKNIQVEAKWSVDDGGVGLTIDENSGVLTWPSDLSAQEVVVIVRVEDNFSKLNSAYVNLTASATITINFVSPKMYIIAGKGRRDVWSSANGKNWEYCNNGIGNRTAPGTAVFKGKIYIFGGRNGEFTSHNTNGVSSMKGCGTGNQWEPVKENNSSYWSKRDGLEVVVFNNTLFLSGGLTGGSWKNDVWTSTDGASWTSSGNGSLGNRSKHRMVSYKGKLYVSGGETSTSNSRGDVMSSADGKTWSTIARVTGNWPARQGHGFVVHKGTLFIIGGAVRTSNTHDNYFNDIWSSEDGARWTIESGTIGSPRGYFRAVSLNGKIYIMGGQRLGELNGSVYQLVEYDDVWSSTDGVSWTIETRSAGNWAARYQHGVVLSN